MADHDALVALHTALIDARTGYRKALESADDSTIKPILQNVHDLHGQAHADVHAMLNAAGLQPDESGSFMSTVHKTVIGVRSAVVGLDAGSLSSFASGEENNLAKYDEAIKSEPANAAKLGGHRAKLEQAIDAMKQQSA